MATFSCSTLVSASSSFLIMVTCLPLSLEICCLKLFSVTVNLCLNVCNDKCVRNVIHKKFQNLEIGTLFSSSRYSNWFLRSSNSAWSLSLSSSFLDWLRLVNPRFSSLILNKAASLLFNLDSNSRLASWSCGSSWIRVLIDDSSWWWSSKPVWFSAWAL